MNRRIWIKQIVMAGGGLLLLPACNTDEGAAPVTLKNIAISAKEEKLLAEITEAIIPATNTPGAKALNLHHFVLKMMDDCYDKPEQDRWINGLQRVNEFADKTAGQRFLKLSTEQKLQVFKGMANHKSVDNELKYFLDETRRWAIKGYETSEYVMTKIIPYELVPGRFHGCVKIIKSV